MNTKREDEAAGGSGERAKFASSIDEIIDLYKRDVDRTLLRENLKLTPTERLEKLERMLAFVEEARRAGREMRQREKR